MPYFKILKVQTTKYIGYILEPIVFFLEERDGLKTKKIILKILSPSRVIN